MNTGMEAEAGAVAARERLSALVDGELDEAQIGHACLHWRDDADARAAWHAYQWIGDVLRSDDLGSVPGRDARFLATLRERLAAEPVIFAPQAAAVVPEAMQAVAGRRSWRTPAAVAAGFVAVVGVVVATRFTAPPPALARATPDPSLVAASTEASAGPAGAVDARGLAASNQLIRDVRLDRYLSAHKEFAGSSALGVPSGFLRNATADAADR